MERKATNRHVLLRVVRLKCRASGLEASLSLIPLINLKDVRGSGHPICSPFGRCIVFYIKNRLSSR